MNLLKLKICVLLTILSVLTVEAQRQVDVRSSVMIIRGFRNSHDFQDGKDILKEAVKKKKANKKTDSLFIKYDFYQKTSVDFVGDKNTLKNQFQKEENHNNTFFNKYIAPFQSWLEYARDVPGTDDLALTTLLYEDYKTITEDRIKNRFSIDIKASRNTGFFETIGKQNVLHFLDEMFGDVDFYQNHTEMMLLEFKNPFSEKNMNIYQYNLTGIKNITGTPCYEIVFFAKNEKENAFAGYLYIATDGTYALRKAVFTLNSPGNMNFLKDILITHDYEEKNNMPLPVKKETAIVLGDEIKGSIFVSRVSVYSGYEETNNTTGNWKPVYGQDFDKRDSLYWNEVRPIPLTPAQTQIDELMKIAPENTVFTRAQELIIFLLSDHITIGGVDGKVEIGPILQFISYNDMEGLRLKFGGNTNVNLMNRFLVGGYVAYGVKDERWKYRGDLIYSFFPRYKYIWEYPKRLLSLSYVSDLNIPGEDLLTTTRDNVVYSFSHTSTNNMSLQKIAVMSFESENRYNFSYKIGAKYMDDNPVGVVKYMTVDENQETTIVDKLITSEITCSFRYAPREKFIQNRDKRVNIRKGDVEVKLNHRVGLKGIFSSDYNYQITDLNAYKKFSLSNNVGSLDVRLSGGMVWNKIPFPLLFIPIGNQSYIYQAENYNCMNFYEFTTDRFVAGNLGFVFNWSPVKWFNKNSKIKTTLGGRAIYGPLSDKNNPSLHPDLFVFNEGVKPLGEEPYTEINIGLANLFKILRVDYARRLTYTQNSADGGNKPNRGTFLITGSFAF